MKTLRLRIGAAICGVALVSSLPAVAFAAATSTHAVKYINATGKPLPGNLNLPGRGGGGIPEGLASCNDYYRFQSMPISLSVIGPGTPGSTEALRGTLTNANKYPMVAVDVYAKIFHMRTGATDGNGPDVVAEFPLIKDAVVDASSSLPLSAIWTVPDSAVPGQYEVATYVVASDRFEMQGLDFTDDVVGGLSPFTVTGTGAGNVHFDRAGATLNGKRYQFIAFPPTISATSSAVVALAVDNPLPDAAHATVEWNLSYWDDLRGEESLDHSNQEVAINGHSSATASYTIGDTAHSVYYLTAKILNPDGSASYAAVRIARDGVDIPRINFVAPMAYPLANGTPIVACVHSSGTASSSDNVLTLTATRTGGIWSFLRYVGIGTLASKTYKGDIPGVLSALALPSSGAADSFDVTATLTHAGARVDSVTVSYSCAALKKCTPTPLWETLGIAVLAAVGMLALVLLILLRRKRPTPPTLV